MSHLPTLAFSNKLGYLIKLTYCSHSLPIMYGETSFTNYYKHLRWFSNNRVLWGGSSSLAVSYLSDFILYLFYILFLHGI